MSCLEKKSENRHLTECARSYRVRQGRACQDQSRFVKTYGRIFVCTFISASMTLPPIVLAQPKHADKEAHPSTAKKGSSKAAHEDSAESSENVQHQAAAEFKARNYEKASQLFWKALNPPTGDQEVDGRNAYCYGLCLHALGDDERALSAFEWCAKMKSSAHSLAVEAQKTCRPVLRDRDVVLREQLAAERAAREKAGQSK